MNPARLPVVIAVIVAFVAGIGVGYFISDAGMPGTSAGTGAGSANSPAASDSAGAKVASHSERDAPLNSSDAPGADAVQRFWTVLTIADERERQVAWLTLLSELTPADALQVRDLFRKMEAEGRRYPFEWSAFWPRWGEVDAPGALEYLKHNEWPSWRPEAAEMIIRGWAKKDPNAARAWLTANPTSSWYDGALRGYLDGLARTDLDRATNELAALAKGRPHLRLMEVLTEQALQQRQLGGMLSWWQALPDDPGKGSARREAIGHIYWRLQNANMDRAAQWVGSLAGTPYRSDQHIGEIAEKMASKDPASAVEWVSSLPPNPADGRYTAIGRTVTALARTDAAAVEQWLGKLPESPLRDQAAAAYVRHLQGQNKSVLADKWLSTIRDRSLVQPQESGAIDALLRQSLR